MKLVVLGSGVCVPRLERHSPGYLLKVDNKLLLFDSGPGTIYQLLKLGVDLNKIDHMFYTHYHNDHISDLPALVHSYSYGIYRKKPLNIYGPKDFRKYFSLLFHDIMKQKRKLFKINILENREQVRIGNIKITIKPMKHPKAIGYRLEYKNKVFAYAGDTGYAKEVIGLAENADLLLIECSYPDEKKEENHMTPTEVGRLAEKAKVKTLVLTHIHPVAEKYDIKKVARKNFKGKVILAKDLMEIKF